MRILAFVPMAALLTVSQLSFAQAPAVLFPGIGTGARTAGDPELRSVEQGRAVVTLTFEGVPDGQSIGQQPGAFFVSYWKALVDEDAGGSGNTANEPSGETVAYFSTVPPSPAATRIIFDAPVRSVSFYYSQNTDMAVPNVYFYDPCDRLLGSAALEVCGSNDCGAWCAGDPQGDYCWWQLLGFNDPSGNGIAFLQFDTNVRLFTVIDNFAYDDQVVDAVIFCDGFEQGNTDSWTHTVQ
jgi:hypothetical protein